MCFGGSFLEEQFGKDAFKGRQVLQSRQSLLCDFFFQRTSCNSEKTEQKPSLLHKQHCNTISCHIRAVSDSVLRAVFTCIFLTPAIRPKTCTIIQSIQRSTTASSICSSYPCCSLVDAIFFFFGPREAPLVSVGAATERSQSEIHELTVPHAP